MNRPFRFALEDNYGPEAPASAEVRRATQAIFDALMKFGVDEEIIGDAFISLYGETYAQALADGEAATEEAPLDHGYTVMGRQKRLPAKSREMERRLELHLAKREDAENSRLATSVLQRS